MAKFDKKTLSELNELVESVQIDPNNLEDEKSSYEPTPEGTYEGVINEVELTESASGNPMFKIVVEILEGELEGRKHFVFFALSGTQAERNMKRFKTTVAKFGVDTSTLEAMQEGFEDMVDVGVIMEVTHSPNKKNPSEPYVNTSIKPAE